MKTRVREWNIIGIDPTRFRVDGRGYWRDDEGRVFEDAVLVLQNREDAYWVSLACGQICFLHLSHVKEPNGYLLELPEAELNCLFQDSRITGYTVLKRKGLDEALPKSFTVLSADEAEAFKGRELTPIFYEFVYVQQPSL
jgi:hypothetical protein